MQNLRFSTHLATLAIAAGALAAPLITEAQALPQQTAPRAPRIVVSGSGTTKASPDVAFVSLGVLSTGRRAQEASQANAAASQKIMAALRQQGVDEKDIQTTNYFVQPVTDPRDGTKITGYQISNVVRATVRKLDNVGKVVDAGLEAGANNVQGVSFGLEKRDTAEERALTAAVKEARRKADIMAKAAGVRIVAIEEINSAFEGRPMPMMESYAMRGVAMAATPVSPGELDVNANVTMIFTISPGGPGG